MRFLVVAKRFIPFMLTFAVGLFIASFFVSIAAPRFNFNRGWKKQRENNRLRYDNQWLREENNRLSRENIELKSRKFVINPEFDLDLSVPPPPPLPPVAPKAPRTIR